MSSGRGWFLPAAFAFLLACFSPLSLSAAEEGKSASLQKLYLDYLTAEGYRPEIDKDGDVVFKQEGLTFFISVPTTDAKFFMVVLPNIWPIESEGERLKVLAAADYVNSSIKVVKVYTVKDNIWVSAEVYVDSPEDFKGTFKRSLETLRGGREKFAQKMRE